MQFQFDIGSTTTKAPAPVPITGEVIPDLLRQMLELQRDQLSQLLEVQKEHLHHVRAAAQENVARWRNLLNRWQNEFPELAGACRKAYPAMEKAYVQLLSRMVEEISADESETLDNEFAVQEFIDRYGMRVGQLSHLLSIVGPLADAAQQQEEANKQQQQKQG